MKARNEFLARIGSRRADTAHVMLRSLSGMELILANWLSDRYDQEANGDIHQRCQCQNHTPDT